MAYGKQWRATASPQEIARVAAMTRGYYRNAKDKRLESARARRLRVEYGITAATYDALFAIQNGRCACCNAQHNAGGKRLHVDHDHETGAVRGLICGPCNLGIGSLGDNIDGIRRALKYLERAQQHPPVRSGPMIRINLMTAECRG